MNRARFVATTVLATAAPRIGLAQGLASVRLGTIANESSGLAIYAREQGFFARNGIDVQLEYIGGASPGITAALVGGAIDVGCISMGAGSNAHLRGIPLRLIAAGGIITIESPTTLLCVPKGSPIQSARDLNGKTVSTAGLHEVQHVAEAKWIDQNGGDSRTVKWLEISGADVPVALMAGRIDASPIGEPILTNTAGELRPIGNPYDVFGRRIMISVHIAQADWLAKNTDLARRVVRSLREAAPWANTSHAATATILARVTKIPIETIAKMHHVVFGETLDLAIIQPQIDALADYKYIERRFDVGEMIWRAAPA